MCSLIELLKSGSQKLSIFIVNEFNSILWNCFNIYNSKASITFNSEIVSSIDDVDAPQPDRIDINYTNNVNYVDPPSTRVPSNKINTNRIPPILHQH